MLLVPFFQLAFVFKYPAIGLLNIAAFRDQLLFIPENN